MRNQNDPREIGTSEVSNTASARDRADGSRESPNVESGAADRPIAEEQADQQNGRTRDSDQDAGKA
jgi:hypothetical protein